MTGHANYDATIKALRSKHAALAKLDGPAFARRIVQLCEGHGEGKVVDILAELFGQGSIDAGAALFLMSQDDKRIFAVWRKAALEFMKRNPALVEEAVQVGLEAEVTAYLDAQVRKGALVASIDPATGEKLYRRPGAKKRGRA
jgi:hypothetical protein